MGKPAQGALPFGVAKAFNQGYHDGYTKQAPNSDKFPNNSSAYSRAWITGREDRAEDEAAMESGTFDLLTDDERRELYGDEEQSSHYRDIGD